MKRIYMDYDNERIVASDEILQNYDEITDYGLLDYIDLIDDNCIDSDSVDAIINNSVYLSSNECDELYHHWADIEHDRWYR